MTTIATESWTGTTGAAWPSQWTTGPDTVATVQSGWGRLRNAGQFYARAFLNGMAASADIDLTVEWRMETTESGQTASFSIVAGNTSWNTPDNAYTVDIVYQGGTAASWEMFKRVSATKTSLGFGYITVTPTAGYKMRVQRIGSTLRFRYWLATDAEPSTWMATATDSALTTGRVQLALTAVGGTTRTAYYRGLTVTDGASGSPSYNGSVGLSGAGTLALAGSPSPAGAAGLTGAGTLALTGSPAPTGAAELSGSGTLAFSGAPAAVGGLGLSGAGGLGLAGTPRHKGSQNLTGLGVLSIAGSTAPAGSLSRSGQGTLALSGYASFTPAYQGALTLGGQGALALTGRPAFARTLALAGAGALTLSGNSSVPALDSPPYVIERPAGGRTRTTARSTHRYTTGPAFGGER